MNLAVVAMVAASAAMTTGAIYGHKRWRDNAVVRLEAGSQIIETARGPIEYTIVDEGASVLIAHGSPGGYDAG